MWSSGPQHHQKWFKNEGRDGYVNYCKGDLEMFLVFMLWRAVRPISGLKWAAVIPRQGGSRVAVCFFFNCSRDLRSWDGGDVCQCKQKKNAPSFQQTNKKQAKKKPPQGGYFPARRGSLVLLQGINVCTIILHHFILLQKIFWKPLSSFHPT